MMGGSGLRSRPAGTESRARFFGVTVQVFFNLPQDAEMLARPQEAERRAERRLAVGGDRVANAVEQAPAASFVDGVRRRDRVGLDHGLAKRDIPRMHGRNLGVQVAATAFEAYRRHGRAAGDDIDHAACRTRAAPATRAATFRMLVGWGLTSARYCRNASSRRSAAVVAARAAAGAGLARPTS